MRKVCFFVVIVVLLTSGITSNGDAYSLAQAEYQVTVEIDRARIVEDRDFGAAEIYFKARIDSGSWTYTDIYQNINDGDTIDMNWVILDDIRDSFSLRIEVWESDDAFNEVSNDFLGYVEYTRSSVQTISQWHDAAGRIGGNNNLQAQLYIVETAEDVTGPEITSPADVTYNEGTTGNTISWTATDSNPDEYRITRNGNFADSGTWISSSPIIYNVDNLDAGSYVFVMTVSDDAGNSASDTVVVTVEVGGFPGGNDPTLSFMTPVLLSIVGLVALVAIFVIFQRRGKEQTVIERTTTVLVVCPYCSTKVDHGQSFCSNCGGKM